MKWLTEKFLTWWLRSGRYGWSGIRRKVCERKYLSADLPPAASLEEIETCLKQVTWTMDGFFHLFDSISYPQTVWAKKKDDCDGFAVLACELLKRLDETYNPVLITAMMHPVKKSHSVCVFSMPEEGFGVFDNGRLKKTFTSYAQVVETISKNAQALICWDVRRHQDFEMLEFHLNG